MTYKTYETPASTNSLFCVLDSCFCIWKKFFIPCNVYLQNWYELWEGEIECYFNGIQKSKVSKLQSEKLLLISAFFFHFVNISNGIRGVNSNEFLNSTEILKVKNFLKLHTYLNTSKIANSKLINFNVYIAM